jgi:hypothetical protein
MRKNLKEKRKVLKNKEERPAVERDKIVLRNISLKRDYYEVINIVERDVSRVMELSFISNIFSPPFCCERLSLVEVAN